MNRNNARMPPIPNPQDAAVLGSPRIARVTITYDFRTTESNVQIDGNFPIPMLIALLEFTKLKYIGRMGHRELETPSPQADPLEPVAGEESA